IKGSTGDAVVWSVIAVFAAATAIVFVTVDLHDLLPPLLIETSHARVSTQFGVALTAWFINLAVLIVLGLRRPHSALDIWIMVAMCARLFDVTASAVLNAGRFDAGFYLGRLYGLGAAFFVLTALLVQNIGLQA